MSGPSATGGSALHFCLMTNINDNCKLALGRFEMVQNL